MKSWYTRIFFYTIFLVLPFIISTPVVGCGKLKINFDADWQTCQSGDFILAYTLKGRHALKHPKVSGGSAVPDVVADVALQLKAMQAALRHLGFQQPLDSPRYQQQKARRVFVVFRHLEKGNGNAFDEVRRIPSGDCALLITLGSHLNTGSLTPAHEYFHLVQYGYTMFKCGWYLEGLARWSETVLGRRPFNPQSIPKTDAELEQLWASRYAAVWVWQGFMQGCDATLHKVGLPADLLALRYSNGQPVVADDLIPGYKFVRHVLEAFDKLDQQISREQGWKPHHWEESIQKSPQFNRRMWQTVHEAAVLRHD